MYFNLLIEKCIHKDCCFYCGHPNSYLDFFILIGLEIFIYYDKEEILQEDKHIF